MKHEYLENIHELTGYAKMAKYSATSTIIQNYWRCKNERNQV